MQHLYSILTAVDTLILKGRILVDSFTFFFEPQFVSGKVGTLSSLGELKNIINSCLKDLD